MEKKPEMLKGIAVLFLTLATLLLVFEGLARLSYPLYADYNTEMWRYSLEVKRISSNPELVREHRPHVKTLLYGAWVETNADGFRDKDYPKKKNDSIFRILVLGDSITFGWGVATNETYSALLEEELNLLVGGGGGRPSSYTAVEVINTGVGNYNTQMELAVLKEKGLVYHPDLIILEYYTNDAELGYKKAEPIMIKKTYLYAFLWDKLQNIKAKVSSHGYYQSFYADLYTEGFQGKKNMEKSLREIIRISKENNIPTLIAVFPEFHQFDPYPFSYVTSLIKGIAQEENASFVDLLPSYMGTNPQDIWVSQEDVHPNALGHKIAANAILDAILEKKLIEAKRKG